MEWVVAWSEYEIEPYGVDSAPGLVDLARARLTAWAHGIWVADAATWTPPFHFDFVHVRLEIGPLDRIPGFGRRPIVSSDGSFRG